jgi:CRISPR-associated protein Cmr5
MSRQQTLEQKRAAAAWASVTAPNKKAYSDKYGQLAKSGPASIQANGLGQTLAFWRAKGKHKSNDEHEALYQDVSAWVREQLHVKQPDLLDWIMNHASTDQYRQATAEAIAFLGWLKRFAEAEL